MAGDRSQSVRVRPGGRALLLLLVTTVLTGLLGMHGLAQASIPASTPGEATSSHPDHHTAPLHEQLAGDWLCHHHSTGGHSAHAVSDCAATGVSTVYLPPVPGSSPYPAVAFTLTPRLWTSVERAPPDLAQLQLLRI